MNDGYYDRQYPLPAIQHSRNRLDALQASRFNFMSSAVSPARGCQCGPVRCGRVDFVLPIRYDDPAAATRADTWQETRSRSFFHGECATGLEKRRVCHQHYRSIAGLTWSFGRPIPDLQGIRRRKASLTSFKLVISHHPRCHMPIPSSVELDPSSDSRNATPFAVRPEWIDSEIGASRLYRGHLASWPLCRNPAGDDNRSLFQLHPPIGSKDMFRKRKSSTGLGAAGSTNSNQSQCEWMLLATRSFH